MSTAVKFLVLYLTPILSFAGTTGIYLLAYGGSLDNPIIDFALLLIISGFITSSYFTVKLISHFVIKKVNYLGILFSLFGFILGLIPIWFYFVMFEESFNI